MTKKSLAQLILISTACVSALPITCNSILAKRKADADDGYEYVKVSGSMIPQRVKKGDALVTSSPTSGASAEQFDKMRQQMQQGGAPKGN